MRMTARPGQGYAHGLPEMGSICDAYPQATPAASIRQLCEVICFHEAKYYFQNFQVRAVYSQEVYPELFMTENSYSWAKSA